MNNRLCAFMLVGMFGLSGQIAWAGPTFQVNTFDDSLDRAPGDGKCQDSNGLCSLRAAVAEGNALANVVSIELQKGTYSLGAYGQLDIQQGMNIRGQGGSQTTLTTHGASRVILIRSGNVNTVQMSKLRIEGGNDETNGGQGGAGIYIQSQSIVNLIDSKVIGNSARGPGAGIANGGNLHVIGTSIMSNKIPMEEGGGVWFSGGGIMNFQDAVLYLTDSTVSYNEATRGGGLRNGGGVVEILNSTISHNTVSKRGGGIMNYGYMSISFSTIAYNRAGMVIGGSSEKGFGGGIYSEGNGEGIALGNSIVALNSNNTRFSPNNLDYAPDCYFAPGQGQPFQSHGGNVIGVLNSYCPLVDVQISSATPDKIGTGAQPLNPGLGELTDNGAGMSTLELNVGSPAINQGTGEYTCPRYDQRGHVRPTSGPCDAGAYEFDAPPSFPVPGRAYKIVSGYSGKCLDMAGTTRDNGAITLQYDCTNAAPDQRFTFSPLADGSYYLINEYSQKCLTVQEFSANNGAALYQWDCSGKENQKIRILSSNNGFYSIRFNHSNKCMDLSGPSMDNRQKVHQWECQGKSNQDWSLREAEGF